MTAPWGLTASMSGISMLAYYHTVAKPLLWSFLIVAILHRVFAYTIWRVSATFYKPPIVDAPPIPAPVSNGNDPPKEDELVDENDADTVPVSPVPPPVPVEAKDESEAISWMLEYAKGDIGAGYMYKNTYRLYKLWVPLIMRQKDDAGVPAWFSVMDMLTKTTVIIAVIAITVSLATVFSYQLAQQPILGLISCDKETIDAALHCDAYTESCHLTPPCGPHDVDYIRLVETYHTRCTGTAYPKIAMIKNICFMEKDGNNDNNSWRHVWMKLVGSDFYSLEHTLVTFYRSKLHSAKELRRLMNEPVRVFYDQIGSLVGYGANTVTPTGVTRTNINHDDLMSTLTTWRNKKLSEKRRQKPCICAPHIGILNRMLFLWESDINMWKIYLDHNVSSVNTVYGDSDGIPRYDDFPHNVDTEIAVSVRGEETTGVTARIYPAASTIDLLEISMNVANVRSIDIQTTQQIRRHWGLEGPVLQSQIPHVYFDASLEAYHRTATNGMGFSGMSHRDGVVLSQRITDPLAACYYQCARIFDEIEEK